MDNMKITPGAPAFPLALPHPQSDYAPGLSKREYFAAKAMQGLLSCDYVGNVGKSGEEVANMAIEYADALINELNK